MADIFSRNLPEHLVVALREALRRWHDRGRKERDGLVEYLEGEAKEQDVYAERYAQHLERHACSLPPTPERLRKDLEEARAWAATNRAVCELLAALESVFAAATETTVAQIHRACANGEDPPEAPTEDLLQRLDDLRGERDGALEALRMERAAVDRLKAVQAALTLPVDVDAELGRVTSALQRIAASSPPYSLNLLEARALLEPVLTRAVRPLSAARAAMLAVTLDALGEANFGPDGCLSWEDVRDEHQQTDDEERGGTTFEVITAGAERVRAVLLEVFDLAVGGKTAVGSADTPALPPTRDDAVRKDEAERAAALRSTVTIDTPESSS